MNPESKLGYKEEEEAEEEDTSLLSANHLVLGLNVHFFFFLKNIHNT